MRKITVYALSTCAVCKRVRKFLDDNGISYALIEVDTLDSGEQWLMSKELAKRNPQATYPTVVIEDVVVGYDLQSLTEKLLPDKTERQ